MNWTDFLRRITADLENKGKPVVYWVIGPDTRQCKELSREFKSALNDPQVQTLERLVYIPKRLTVYFYSPWALKTAPVCPLDGVLLLTELPADEVKRLNRRLAKSHGWMDTQPKERTEPHGEDRHGEHA